MIIELLTERVNKFLLTLKEALENPIELLMNGDIEFALELK